MERQHFGFILGVEVEKEVKKGLVGGEGRLKFVVVWGEKGQEVRLASWGAVEVLPGWKNHQFVEKVETLDI